MGRPLKIAKATMLTLIRVYGASNLEAVEVSEDLNLLGIIANTPFIPASNVGGLIGGTTYWVLKVLSAHTFTVSATPINANPSQTPVNLTTVASTSIPLTAGFTDLYFNNPAGAANTYSVVGGNTGIIGYQVLPNVAIGVNGTGTVYTISTSNPSIFGQGTDFANSVVTGTAIQVAVANVNGRPDYVNVGFASSTFGQIPIDLANSTATGNVIRTTGDATLLTVNQPTTFDVSFGNVVAGTTYFVDTIANTSAFTISATLGGAPFQVGTVASITGNVIQDRIVLAANPPINFTNAAYVQSTAEAGYIVRQKGKQKYLVTGSTTGLTAQCLTANVANAALTPNTMSIIGTYANSATVNIQSLSDHTAELFTASSGPVATGNIVFENSNPAFATFNTALAANAVPAQPYPMVTVNKA